MPNVVYGHDIRMIDRRRRTSLKLKTTHPICIQRFFVAQKFDCYASTETCVASPVNFAHAASAQHSLYFIESDGVPDKLRNSFFTLKPLRCLKRRVLQKAGYA